MSVEISDPSGPTCAVGPDKNRTLPFPGKQSQILPPPSNKIRRTAIEIVLLQVRRGRDHEMAHPCQALRSTPASPPACRTSSASASPLLSSSCRALSGRHRFPPHLQPMVLTAASGARRRAASTTCMANPRRVKMVAKQIRRELSDMLLTDKVLQHAVLPEASLGADLYLSSLATISDVEVSADLQVVKVYVSILGDERGREVAMAGLKSKAKYVRSALGRRMKLRLTPEIRFIEDESLERGSRVIAILDRLKDEKKNVEDQDQEQPGRSIDSAEEDDDDNWDIDNADEGIFYVK
ncbi:hypothetical protein Taro_033971 [Colocasia esculenta]|uniref:Ribosome-binding factor A n=1 Tax=Colocasia esculenta TaxID=4460 RepID=A0A843VQ43_COLES|nr:hypothetical protein [Colocasia esculenta]